jgi:hypothetical protein
MSESYDSTAQALTVSVVEPPRDSHLAGSFQLLRAKDLTVIKAIQRRPSADRIRKLRRDWDGSKVGVLMVARITDGEYKGKLHVYDGGSRLLAAYDEETGEGDPEYMFQCVVTNMTFAEAARAFLDFNQLSMKPSAFSRYKVGIRAGDPVALAIEAALDELGLEATDGHSSYGNGSPGRFAAFAAAERIIKNAEKRLEGSYEEASDHFVWVLTMTRAAYTPANADAPAHAHDADIIQAVSFLGLTYPVIQGNDDVERNVRAAMTTWLGKDSKLHTKGTLMTPPHWRVVLASQGKGATLAGSSSRGQQIGELIRHNYNSGGLKPMLRKPTTS